MFNLLVAGHGEAWESEPLAMDASRFKEYSGAEADAIISTQPDSLRRLEEIPTLLMYEVGAAGPNARLVRHGKLRNIERSGRELTFSFEPDPKKAYLNRADILAFADRLGMHRFEQHRTHWALKDGDLPSELLETAVAERPQRTVALVAAEYVEAKRGNNRREILGLEEELKAFPASLEKALSLLPSRVLEHPTPELYPILAVKPRTKEGRAALDAILARNAGGNLPVGWDYSLAWFVELYGSQTEAALREKAAVSCSAHMIGLGADGEADANEEIAAALWRCARSPFLVGRLRREIAMLIDRLVQRQDQGGYWTSIREDGTPVATIRGTALATVSLQRLGDDRHHSAIEKAVTWLIERRRSEDGGLVRQLGDDNPDVIATALTMEAIRRSDLAEDVSHVLSAGETWLVAGQTVLGSWTAEPWPEDFVAAVVLEYLERRGTMLPQVDGFLLMARDFFRKAEELRLEGGANNRRLAAIATVHAVEMFLYGLFEKREDFALSAFKENGTETLGPREALKALQDSLQRLGILAAPRRLAHRDQLSSLIGRRDGIIHRAHEISAAELDTGMRHARRFIEEYGAELLNLDLLQ